MALPEGPLIRFGLNSGGVLNCLLINDFLLAMHIAGGDRYTAKETVVLNHRPAAARQSSADESPTCRNHVHIMPEEPLAATTSTTRARRVMLGREVVTHR